MNDLTKRVKKQIPDAFTKPANRVDHPEHDPDLKQLVFDRVGEIIDDLSTPLLPHRKIVVHFWDQGKIVETRKALLLLPHTDPPNITIRFDDGEEFGYEPSHMLKNFYVEMNGESLITYLELPQVEDDNA
jgi:hypothetical protein